MKKGIYPGSFDPVTYGHIDMIERASKMFDKLYVSITENINKKSFFTLEERLDLLKKICQNYKNVEIVVCQNKLTVDFALELGANVIVRGLRAVTDFEYELQMASTNHQLNSNVETVFMMTNTDYSFLSSSMVKEIAYIGGNVNKFVPKIVEDKIKEKLKKA